MLDNFLTKKCYGRKMVLYEVLVRQFVSEKNIFVFPSFTPFRM